MPTQTLPQSPTVRKNRIFLLSIIALFGVPVLLAWLLVGQWRPSGTVNHGELLNPAQPVAHLQFRQADGQERDNTYLRGRWTLVYLGASCDERCRQGLYNIRQVRFALGKDMTRAQTLFLLNAVPDTELLEWLNQEHATMTAGTADTETVDFFKGAFPGSTTLGDWIYLIDPLGNLFMRYNLGDEPKGILDDLKRLFKYSKIG